MIAEYDKGYCSARRRLVAGVEAFPLGSRAVVAPRIKGPVRHELYSRKALSKCEMDHTSGLLDRLRAPHVRRQDRGARSECGRDHLMDEQYALAASTRRRHQHARAAAGSKSQLTRRLREAVRNSAVPWLVLLNFCK